MVIFNSYVKLPEGNQNHALCWAMMFERTNPLPSGLFVTVRHGKSQSFMGKPSISMGI